MFRCPADASFVESAGVCRCNAGFFRVKGTSKCAPLSRLRTVLPNPHPFRNESLPAESMVVGSSSSSDDGEDYVLVILVCAVVGVSLVVLLLHWLVVRRRERRVVNHGLPLYTPLSDARSLDSFANSVDEEEDVKEKPAEVVLVEFEAEEVEEEPTLDFLV